ncbi:hypothetical protein C8R47DRAFT_1084749 [Mycena vitilis]|nr:hypothetical protein C8R47DRAFT_1084749 [Mycena vitilis]
MALATILDTVGGQCCLPIRLCATPAEGFTTGTLQLLFGTHAGLFASRTRVRARLLARPWHLSVLLRTNPLFHIVQYLRSINWETDGIPALAPAAVKLHQLVEEMECTIKTPPVNTPPPVLPTGSKRSAGDALSDDESFLPPTKIRTTRNGSVTLEESDDSEEEDEPSPTPSTSHRPEEKPIVDSGSESNSGSDASLKSAKPDGMLADIEVQPFTPATESKLTGLTWDPVERRIGSIGRRICRTKPLQIRRKPTSQFKQRYLKLRGTPTAVSVPVKKAPALKLRRSVVINDDTGDSTRAEVHVNPLKPWLDEYQQYLSAVEVVPPGMDTIQWWGVRCPDPFL